MLTVTSLVFVVLGGLTTYGAMTGNGTCLFGGLIFIGLLLTFMLCDDSSYWKEGKMN